MSVTLRCYKFSHKQDGWDIHEPLAFWRNFRESTCTWGVPDDTVIYELHKWGAMWRRLEAGKTEIIFKTDKDAEFFLLRWS